MAPVAVVDKQAIRRRFDRAAPGYDTYSQIQRDMADRLIDAISRPPLSILELGCGTGYLTWLLRERFPQAALEAVDFAPAMIARASARVPNASYVVADIEELELEPEWYDLIISSATVQWLAEPAATRRATPDHLRPAHLPGARPGDERTGPRARPALPDR